MAGYWLIVFVIFWSSCDFFGQVVIDLYKNIVTYICNIFAYTEFSGFVQNLMDIKDRNVLGFLLHYFLIANI